MQAGREAVRAAKQRPRKRKQTYAVRRGDVRYRFSMFKAQATRRGKEVELLRHDYARILRQPCLYCGSTDRRRPRAERRALHARQLGAVLRDMQLHEGLDADRGLCGACASRRREARCSRTVEIDALTERYSHRLSESGTPNAARGGALPSALVLASEA